MGWGSHRVAANAPVLTGAVAGTVLFLCPIAGAAVNTSWDGSDGNSDWHDLDNWSTNTVPTVGDSAFLGIAAPNVAQVIDLGSTDTAAIFRVVVEGNLGNRSYTINSSGGGKLVLSRIDHSANDQGLTINAPVQFAASNTIAGDGDQLLRLTNVAGGTVNQGDGATRVRIGGVNTMTGSWQMATSGWSGQHLTLAHDNALPAAQLRLFGGAAKVSLAANPTVGTSLEVGSTLTLNIAETSGDRTLTVNTTVLRTASTSGQVVIGANESGITGNLTLKVKGAATHSAPISTITGSTVQYDIASGTATLNSVAAISGGGKVVKSNAGTLSVNSVNTYTGGTDLTGGTLRLATTGSLPDSGAIKVGTGTTLDFAGLEDTIGSLVGTGTVTLSGSGNAGMITAAEGVAPGNSIGTLVIHSGATFPEGTLSLSPSSNSTFELDVPGTGDLVDMNNTATQLVLDGTLTIVDAGGLTTGIYTLFDMIGTGKVTGAFDLISMPSGFTGAVSTDLNGDVILTVAVPEPSLALAAIFMAGGAMVARRRRW